MEMIRQKVYQLEQTQIKMKQEYVTASYTPLFTPFETISRSKL